MEGPALTQFQCPDERHPVSRAVHLARLAAAHPACVGCPRRHDELAIPPARRRLELADKRAAGTPASTNGLRGLYRNVLTRERMEQVAAAVASLLWERSPRTLTLLPDHRRPLRPGPNRISVGPRLVVGHDPRFSSADLTVGLVTGLRRAGCSIVDVGLLHRPALDFAVDHFHADLGLYVTGGGRPEDWNGLDLVEPGGGTWSAGGKLDDLYERLRVSPARPSRSIGPCRTVTVLETYAAGLLHQFHAIRPLRVAVTCANPITAGLLSDLGAKLPCSLRVNHSPQPFGDAPLPPVGLANALADMVHREHLDLGVLIASDGQGCFVLDECGDLLSTSDMLTILAQTGEASPGSNPSVIVPPTCTIIDNGLFQARHAAADQHELLLNEMREHRSPLATDDCGRYWQSGLSPACDAIVTLARVLQFFSLSDHTASRLLHRGK